MTMGFHNKKEDTEEDREKLAEIYSILFDECIKKIDFKKISKIKKLLKKKNDSEAGFDESSLQTKLEYLFEKTINSFLNAEKIEDIRVDVDGFSMTIRKDLEIEILYILEEVSAVVSK